MNTSKLKTVQTIHIALCLGILMFGVLSFVIGKEKMFFNASLVKGDMMYPLFPIVAIILVLTGFLLFTKQLSSVDGTLPVEQKLVKYQSAFIIKAFFVEAAALMNIVGFLVTSNLIFLIVGGIVFLIFLSLRPTKDSIIEALNLSFPDTEKL